MQTRRKIILRYSTNRRAVRDAASLAMRYWPNSHLGELSRRDDLRSAFRLIRNYVNRGLNVQQAAGVVEMDAYRHADM